MKKIFIFGIIVLFLISFAIAQENSNSDLNNSKKSNVSNQENNQISTTNQNQGETNSLQIKNIVRERNSLRISAQKGECPENCTCTGSVKKCSVNGGREMTVTAGKSGNIIVQVKGVNMTTNVTLYSSDGKVYSQLENNQTKEIKVFPDEARDKIKERIKAKLENFNITLNENGTYQVQAQKKARLFFLFPVKEKMNVQMDSETGEIVKIKNPWWGFLSKDVKEENSSEE